MTTPSHQPRNEFYETATAELRKHFVESVAIAAGIEPAQVYRALIVGTPTGPDGAIVINRHAIVTLNDDVKVLVFIGDDEILTADEVVAKGRQGEMRGVILGVERGVPFSFFDVSLGYLSFDYRGSEEKAQRYLLGANQFWYAAQHMVFKGGYEAACENMFAAAELATMALMQVGGRKATEGHKSRARWLQESGSDLGLSSAGSRVVQVLYDARNDWRYDDGHSPQVPVDLVKLVPIVAEVVDAARAALIPPAAED